MIPFIRAISLILGCILIFTPSFFLFAFAAGIGEAYTSSQWQAFLPWLAIGFILGGGLFLTGVPPKLTGSQKPSGRAFVGLLLLLSAASISLVGFSGVLTAVISPPIIAFELIVFYLFVFPAKNISAMHSNNA